MAEPSVKGDYVTLSGVNIWWTPGQPDEIHLTADDPDLTHVATGPGMRVVFSTNIKSANYHPANFNRTAAILRKYGKSAPPEDVPEGPRRLDRRPGAVATKPKAKAYERTGDEADGPYDVQLFRPDIDPIDPLGHVGSAFHLMGWLNMHSMYEVVSLTAIPQNDGGPPVYVVVWRKP